MQSRRTLQVMIDEAFASTGFFREPPELYHPIDYALRNSGKRLRPLLVLMGCDLFGGDIGEALHPAMAMEIFHNFTLLHDDIMDRAPLRRGKETVYKKYDINTAILSGDTMFVLAYEYIARTNPLVLQKILNLFNETARMVCEGQQYDMNYETTVQVTDEDYIQMIRLKTAVLLACSMKTGAILAGAPEPEAEKAYRFGENLGLAFQLQDDWLDVFGDSSKFGKELGGDIITNKKTFLFLKAFELAREDTLIRLTQNFYDKEVPEKEKVSRITAIYRQLKVDEITHREIEYYLGKALEWLDQIAVEESLKSELKALAQEMLARER
ncbi:MAG: polyprenyl synthetase family protein [bacterium]